MTSHNTPRIFGGEPAVACQWPTVVDMSTCSGMLVHPNVVVYAGHCGPQGSIQFGNLDFGFSLEIDQSDCEVHPLWTLEGNDIAYCELPVSVDEVPLVHMLGPNEPLPQQGEMVTLVGYGQTEDGPTNGLKHFGEAPFINLENGELRIGGNGTDTCVGDSGGPAMAEMFDGTWRIIGITSKAEDSSELCGGISRYTYAPTAVAWVEEMSGIDISPCFDGEVSMDCGPSHDSPDDPNPDWCDWGENVVDETGASGDAGGPSTGDTWEESLDTTEGIDAATTGWEEVPSDDGCSCSAGSGVDAGIITIVTIYLIAKRWSS